MLQLHNTVNLGGTASNIAVARIGHGLMRMTWRPDPVSDEVAFEAIKTGLDSLPAGAKMLLNSSEFYGINPRTANVELVARFFEKYPSYVDKAFLSVKGGSKPDRLERDASPENLRQSVDGINSKLRGTKRLDHFECARVDEKYEIEDQMRTLAGFVAEGKFDHVGLSEVTAEQIKRANKIVAVSFVEVEISPWVYPPKIKDVIETCRELKIAVVAYSPVGGGALLNKERNPGLVKVLDEIASKLQVTLGQVCLAWVASRGPHVIPLPGSSNKARLVENLAAGDLILSPEDATKIDAVV
ncbi:aldo/keto reductase [Stereum hirsutum FP-91666 SS1]|uniref:aldo/keto reductase n=1 Tax=Stereum hirsutum (strain FP-91666) TaxID=721885 RepID=UPI000440E78F|nr:aldo/keto reductase [Stereum hirsutum FP-91666 SS1]EIM90156.1 aldo/keto reductase [Stereum hirsutum FP-91666 SS1]